jgi:hypothetical protein
MDLTLNSREQFAVRWRTESLQDSQHREDAIKGSCKDLSATFLFLRGSAREVRMLGGMVTGPLMSFGASRRLFGILPVSHNPRLLLTGRQVSHDQTGIQMGF